jgi:hypothetical protein
MASRYSASRMATVSPRCRGEPLTWERDTLPSAAPFADVTQATEVCTRVWNACRGCNRAVVWA